VSASPSADPAFRHDVLAGLALPAKAIPARWLYDRAGADLFEAITALPEYYPTRTETALLRDSREEVAALTGPGRPVVEFGSGSSTKTPLLLEAVDPAAYVPIDISGEALRDAAAGIARAFPRLEVRAVEADFTRPLTLPALPGNALPLGFFPGSTIGNFTPPSAVDFLRGMAGLLGLGSMLLIGLDLIKDPGILVPAYDDAAGVTAGFNLNLLHRINRELSGDVPADAFAHEARWNDAKSRIEMHLRAERDVSFTVVGQQIVMRAGETIHTENSHKYDRRSARLLLEAGGWTPMRDWVDAEGMFMLLLAVVEAPAAAP
jgi:L-histidine Nalpha-methyltransferase